MIYFKKKSLIKKAVNKIKEKMENFKFPIFSFSRGFFLFFGFFLFTLYSSYLFLLPKYLTGEIIEKAINNYVLKNYKYSLDVAKFVAEYQTLTAQASAECQSTFLEDYMILYICDLIIK